MRFLTTSVRHVGCALVGCALALVVSFSGSTDAEQRTAPPGERVEVLEADATGFSVRLTLAEPSLERVVTDAGPCWRVTLPPVEGSDLPPLPGQTTYGWLVGLPGPGGASIVVRNEEAHTRRVGPLCSAESESATAAERVVVGRYIGESASVDGGETVALRVGGDESVLPSLTDPVVALEDAGVLRHQPVARLVVRPVARAGDDAIVVRRELRIRVDYADPVTVTRAPPADGPFDLLLDGLLNRSYVPRRFASVDVDGRVGSVGDVPSAVGRVEWDRTLSGAPGDPTALKLIVNRDGPVAVTGADLAERGWDLAAVDPAALTLESGGQPVAIALRGAEDGRIDPGDRLIFQGRAMTGLYTRDNVYWLRRAGETLPIGERDGTPRDGVAPARSFTETLHFERDNIYVFTIDQNKGGDRWMWGGQIGPEAEREETVTVHNLGPDPPAARLRVRLQGYTDDRNVNPDHHVRLELNGQLGHDARFDGMGVHVLSADVDPGLLVEGANRIAIQNVGDSGAVVDAVFLNWIEIDYAAGYAATDDRLDFGAPAAGAFTFQLDGFTGPDITVLDVTDPERPVRVTAVQVEDNGEGAFRARFTDTTPEGTRYTAYTPAGTRGPAGLVPNAPSDLRSEERGADYIVITHPNFAEALAPLVARREADGLRVTTVLIDDVYDEFSYGVFDPRAIKSFLRYAFEHWARPAPTYVLLVGESNLDYRRGYNAGPQNYVPSVQLDVTGGYDLLSHYTSDLWFAAVQGDVLPDLLLGRISVSTAAQAQTVVDKILRYEAEPSEADWRKRAVLVADDDGAPAFEALSEELVGLMPPDTDVRRFFAAKYPRDQDLTGDIRAAIDEGAFALNFVGHGNVALWSPWPGGGRIFQTGNIRQLANGDRMPIFTAATCMNGWIDHPLKPVSMTEAWLTHAGGGGVVAWAASGFATVSAEGALLEPFYRGLYDGRGLPVAALTAEASMRAYAQSRGWADTLRMYVLLGDPALVVSGVPLLPTPTPTVKPTPSPTPRPASPVYMPYTAGGGGG